jgi:small subunit ribosomal protein S1
MALTNLTTEPELKVDLDALGVTDSSYETFSESDLRSMYEDTIKDVEEGTILKGSIVSIQDTAVLIDVGYKSEGVISRDEFPDITPSNVGDEVEVLLMQKEDHDGNIRLSKVEADRQRAWERTLAACEGENRITGDIVRKVKGGLMVDIGIEAFLPASQIALQNIKNIDDYIGQEITVKVIKINHERRNVVVSRRELLDEERLLRKRDFLDQVKVGDVKQGVVKNITDFGAFIDLHGIDGLLHLTDMRWGRINHPSEMLQLSEPVDVMIIGIDYDKERVSLGIKQMTDNPWLDVDQRYPVNEVVQGKVVNILPYGAFVELEEGVEGLIHISEFSWTRKVNHPSEFVSLGDEISAMVLNVDPYEQKISLGLRQTQENPWETIEQRYPIGAKVKGTVRNLTSYGAFVELEDGIDGLIHVSDMSWTRKVNHPSEVLKKGDEIDTVILSVNSNERKIALGLKQLADDPWDSIHDHYREGDTVTGKITNTTSFGAFIQLQNEVEGLIHISELADHQVANVRDVVNPGEEVTGKIVRIEPGERKIAVSLKAYTHDQGHAEERKAEREEREAVEEAMRPRGSFESGIDIGFAQPDADEDDDDE